MENFLTSTDKEFGGSTQSTVPKPVMLYRPSYVDRIKCQTTTYID